MRTDGHCELLVRSLSSSDLTLPQLVPTPSQKLNSEGSNGLLNLFQLTLRGCILDVTTPAFSHPAKWIPAS